jgi:hypothetical protein
VMVVEYKGKHLYDSADAEEKRAVGAVWAAREGGGRCLFVCRPRGLRVDRRCGTVDPPPAPRDAPTLAVAEKPSARRSLCTR